MGTVKTILLLFSIMLLGGCGQEPVVKIYPEAKHTDIRCLGLDIYPMDENMREYLSSLYRFDPACKTVLLVRHKEDICCNSSHNAFRRGVSGLPENYLRMEVREGLTPLYSYYIDLDRKADRGDLKRAFYRLKSDLGLK